jgi:hypothetical protein
MFPIIVNYVINLADDCLLLQLKKEIYAAVFESEANRYGVQLFFLVSLHRQKISIFILPDGSLNIDFLS